MQYDFSLDGVLASTKGIILQNPATVSALVPKYIKLTVPKYGTYHIFDGYEDRQLSISAFILSTALSTQITTAYTWLLTPAQRTIVLYSDSTAYYTGTGVLINGGEIQPRAGVLNPFTAVFEMHEAVT